MKKLFNVLFVVSMLLLVGCSSPEMVEEPAAQAEAPSEAPETVPEEPLPAPAEANVQLNGFVATPSDVMIGVGGMVTFTNTGDVAHQIAFKGIPGERSEIMEMGGTYSYTFEEAGTYQFFSSLQPALQGTVTVE